MSKARLVARLVVISLTAPLALGGCSSDEENESTDTIVIGFPLPETGPFSGFGDGSKFGIEAAIDDISALGGVPVGDQKLPVELVIRDNESDPTKAQYVTEDLAANEDVDFIVSGAQPPATHISIGQVAEHFKIPHIVGAGPKEPWLAAVGQPVWEYTWFSGFAIGEPAAQDDFRFEKSGYTIQDTWLGALEQVKSETNLTVGVFAFDDSDGRGWYPIFAGLLEDAGYTVVGWKENLGMLAETATDEDRATVIQEWMDQNVEIVWGNAPAPVMAGLWSTAQEKGFQPKVFFGARGALFYEDVGGMAWGGDAPVGLGTEVWWNPAYSGDECPGIGDTTPESLAQRWTEAKDMPPNQAVGAAYQLMQILFDAIERAGTLDAAAVNQAIGETDMASIAHRIKFDQEHFNRMPLQFGQWASTDTEWGWELSIVHSAHDFSAATEGVTLMSQ